jgi:hypothetical protein
MALLCLHFQCLFSLKREDGSCGLDEDKEVEQDKEDISRWAHQEIIRGSPQASGPPISIPRRLNSMTHLFFYIVIA